MKIYILFYIITNLFFLVLTCDAQSKLLVLKEKDRVLQTWTEGSDISLRLINFNDVNARIFKINDSSIDIRRFELKDFYNSFGLDRTDTFWYGKDTYLFSEILSFPKPKIKSGLFRSGLFFQAFGIAAVSLNLINSLIQNSFQPADGIFIASGVLVWGIGKILKSTYKTSYILGKKYKLESL